MGDTSDPRLVVLAQELAEMTAPLCATECEHPHSCCDAMFCALAKDTARNHGVLLTETGHPTLPYMGKDGCTVPPHLRPACTIFVCSMARYGCRPGDRRWTKRYLRLFGQFAALLPTEDVKRP